MQFYPIKFTPISKYRLWGGNKLKTILNKPFQEENIGESWEISDVENDESIVANGDLAGKTLRELISEYKSDFVGKNVYDSFGEKFPLLIKFIDAKTPLSIQVHPSDELAKERHNSFGKNEMWYVLDADESSEIIVGFNKQISKEQYLETLETGNILSVLNAEKTSAGDAFNIPTGRVHAIGAGIMLAEIQQTSDVTYRIYDYDRVDKTTGEKRELHTELAKDAIDFSIHDKYKTVYSSEENKTNELIHTPYFKTNIINFSSPLSKDYEQLDSFVIYICTKGKLKIKTSNNSYSFNKGESIIIPASLNNLELIPHEQSEILEVYY